MRTREKNAYIVFSIIGVLLLLIALLTPSSPSWLGLLKSLAQDVGVVILSVVIVNWLWNLVGGEPLTHQLQKLEESTTLMKQANDAGLVGVGHSPTAIHLSLLDSIQRSKNNIDLSGYTLYVLQEQTAVLNALEERARSGLQVRILLYDPTNPALPHSVNEQLLSTMKTQMQAVWNVLCAAQARLPEPVRTHFQFRRVHDRVMRMSLWRFDDQLIVLPYLQYKYTQETPVYVVKGLEKPLFQAYVHEFESAFAAGKSPDPCT